MFYYNILFLTSFVLSILYVYRFQKHFDVNITAIFMLVPVSILGNVFLVCSENLDQALVANRIIYLGGCFLPFFITFSIFNLCKINVKPFIRTLLLALNSGIYVCVLLTGRNKFFYESVSFEKTDGIGYLIKDYGPVHTVFILMLGFYVLLGTGTIVYTYFRKKEVSRVMLYLLFLPEFFSVIGYFGGKLFDLKLEMSPITFVTAQIVYLFISERLSYYKTSDIAIETMLVNGMNGYVLGFEYILFPFAGIARFGGNRRLRDALRFHGIRNRFDRLSVGHERRCVLDRRVNRRDRHASDL